MSDSKTKILIVEDHPAMGQGTKVILEQMEMIQIIGVAETGKKGLEMAARFRPEIVILDLNLPDIHGKELTKEIKANFPEIQIIAFTGYDYVPFINVLMENGISGFLSKSASAIQVQRMVECVINGETVIPLDVFRRFRLVEGLEDTGREGWENNITKKEQDILSMVARGFTNVQISNEICVSVRTVEYYLTKIYEKMNVGSRSEAVKLFIGSKI
jgi:DNA-binding NarL/FixJ family response regulator